jgi:hypothetical protein
MKNSLNFVFVALLFVVLGCSCPKLQELANRQASTPGTTPVAANTSSTPDSTSSPTGSTASLTMDKYNQLKDGMAKSEVENILGSKGTEFSSTSGGGYTFSVYQWRGEDYSSITITFKNDKVMSKSQYGLK